jgi:Flp pilus assembly protein TadB
MPQHQCGRSVRPCGPARLDTPLSPDEEFLNRFGDAIDDRVAEILHELLDERDAGRRRHPIWFIGLAGVMLVAVAVGVLFQHNPMAWAIWPSAAVIWLAVAWTARIGRS